VGSSGKGRWRFSAHQCRMTQRHQTWTTPAKPLEGLQFEE
jgi:hypothetical protein